MNTDLYHSYAVPLFVQSAPDDPDHTVLAMLSGEFCELVDHTAESPPPNRIHIRPGKPLGVFLLEKV